MVVLVLACRHGFQIRLIVQVLCLCFSSRSFFVLPFYLLCDFDLLNFVFFPLLGTSLKNFSSLTPIMDANTILGIISFVLLYFSFKTFYFIQSGLSLFKKLLSLLALFVFGFFAPLIYVFAIDYAMNPELVGQISFYLMGWFVASFVLIKYLKLEYRRNETKNNKIKLWLAIIVPVILLLAGFFLF